MSMTAMPYSEAHPSLGRPHLRLLPDLRDEAATRAPRRPANLDAVRAQTDRTALRACRTIGILGTWGTSRWRATAEPDSVVSTYEIKVAGTSPDGAVAQLIAGRLSADGWRARVSAMTPIVRIDAERQGHRLRLVATRGTVTVLVSSSPTVLGERLAQEVLDGLYEED